VSQENYSTEQVTHHRFRTAPVYIVRLAKRDITSCLSTGTICQPAYIMTNPQYLHWQANTISASITVALTGHIFQC